MKAGTRNAAIVAAVSFAAGAGLAGFGGSLGPTLGQSLGIAALAQDSRAETYRLLELFGTVFERVRAEYVVPINDRDAIEAAINGMLASLDPHSAYMNARSYRDMQVQTTGEFGGLGIEVTQENGYVKVIAPIDDTPAARAGVKSGDLITHIDGQTVQGLSLNEAVEKMRGAPRSEIKLMIRREGNPNPVRLAIQRDVIRVQSVRSRLEGDVGYVRVTSFTQQTDVGLRRAIADLRAKANGPLSGLVLDLRNNPGGLLDQAVQVSDDFLDRGEIVSTRGRKADAAQRYNAKSGDLLDGKPIVILINPGSASASEIVAGALQDHRRAVVLGTKSFGKGSVQTVMPLPSQGAIRITTAYYYTPSGRSIQKLGIEPDYVLEQTKPSEISAERTREADLNRALPNANDPNAAAPAAPLAPAIVLPNDWIEATKAEPPPPESATAVIGDLAQDYPLRRALALVRSMAAQPRAAN